MTAFCTQPAEDSYETEIRVGVLANFVGRTTYSIGQYLGPRRLD